MRNKPGRHRASAGPNSVIGAPQSTANAVPTASVSTFGVPTKDTQTGASQPDETCPGGGRKARTSVLDFPEALGHARAHIDAWRQTPQTARLVVLVDGRSGSGKSRFAEQLASEYGEASVLHLDDLYPHWHGLAQGVAQAQELLTAWAAGQEAIYVPTQWPGTPPASVRTISQQGLLIVEGVGALACASSFTANVRRVGYVFDVPADVRRVRALRRDGEAFAPHWDEWATQEEEFQTANPLRAGDVDVIVRPAVFTV